MGETKVSGLPLLSAGSLDTAADFLLVSDADAALSKKIKPAELFKGAFPYVEPVFDFVAGSLPPTVSFTRASAGWRFNSAGVLVSEATDVARFQYDPATLTPRGILIEAAATNVIRNASAVGAVAGTPGTAPTNWSVTTTANNVTREIVGTGTEDGIPYVDIRYSGTPTASSAVNIFTDPASYHVASLGQTWTTAWFLKLVAGSWTNVVSGVISVFVTERTAAGTAITSSATTVAPTGAALGTQRTFLTRTLSDAAVERVSGSIGFNYTNGAAIDFTLRIGLPQLVQSDMVHSPIITTGAAATRARDIALITNPQALADQCYIVKARTPVSSSLTANMVFQVDDGTYNNRRAIYYFNGRMYAIAVVAGVAQATLDLGAVANDTDFFIAARFADNNFAASLNGGAIVTDASGANPLGLTTARIGSVGSSNPWNSTIRYIETRRTASDAELPLLAA